MRAILWFDVEDYITPESDDALLELLTMLEARGLKGTFKVVGEKARRWKERGHKDILTKLSHHEIGYHTDKHSEHPTVSEYLEGMGFREGAVEFERREGRGLADVTEITGKSSVCFGQPGAAWAPQVYPVLKKWSIPTYVDALNVISVDHKPFWYGGILNFIDEASILRMELRENGIEEAQQTFQQLKNSGVSLLSIFYHPCEFATKAFWDGCNYNRGRNTAPAHWRKPPLRTREEMKTYIHRLGTFLDELSRKENIEFITASRLYADSKPKGEGLTGEDITGLAGLTDRQLYFARYKNRTFSAAELHALFAQYMKGEELTGEFMYGPERNIATEGYVHVKVADIKRALREDYPRIYGYKQMPDFFCVAGKAVNPVDMTCTMARIIREDLKDHERIMICEGTLQSAVHINSEVHWGKKWVIFEEDFRAPRIVQLAKLQAWTLKPAVY